MTNRDDMVFRPTLGRVQQATAMTRAREERRIARAKGRGGVLHRIAQYRAARTLTRRRRATRGAVRRREIATGRSTARGGLGAGALLAGVAMAGLATLRWLSGQPLEGTGLALNQMILGDTDERARAAMATRRQLMGDSDVLRITGQEGKVSSQVLSIAQDLNRLNLQEEEGRTLLREEFLIDNSFDMIFKRGVEKAKAAFKSSGGPQSLDRIEGQLKTVIPPAKGR